MMPYHTDITTTAEDADNVEIGISVSNWNLEQWSAIYDAHSGITFSNFGGTAENKKYWHKTLWGLLGFSYDQLNYSYPTSGVEMNVKDRLSFNSRVNPDNQWQTPMLLTNAEVKSSDVSLYRNNIYGAGMFSDQAVLGAIWHAGLSQQSKIKPNEKDWFMNNPAISIEATSVGLKADRQPTKMLRPYYLIKSNIIGDMKYIGSGHSTEGGQMLPIIGVVNKENGFGDFYFQTDQKAIFTITQPRMLSEVITSIHDPDMSSARVDKNSAVLYLIQKENGNNLNVVQGLLQGGGGGAERMAESLEPPTMNDAEYNQYFKTFIMTPTDQATLNTDNVDAHYQDGEPTDAPLGEVGATLAGYKPPPRKVESLLGLRKGETPGKVMGQERYGQLPPKTPASGKLTRKDARQLQSLEMDRQRARVGLSQRFTPEGAPRSTSAPSSADTARSTPSKASVPVSAPSDVATHKTGSQPITSPSEPAKIKGSGSSVAK